MKKKIIYGCDAVGEGKTPFLTRYTLLEAFGFQMCLHIFHRSDGPEMHDHPWGFVSLILWRGYIEEVASRFCAQRDQDGDHAMPMVHWEQRKGLTKKNRVRPGMILFRRHTHAHRVEILDGKPAVTLVIMGRTKRLWGFFTRHGWQNWLRYYADQGCK